MDDIASMAFNYIKIDRNIAELSRGSDCQARKLGQSEFGSVRSRMLVVRCTEIYKAP